MGLKMITAPLYYPLTVEEIKQHVRDDSSAEDTLHLANLIAATDYVEEVSGHQLITATYELTTGPISYTANWDRLRYESVYPCWRHYSGCYWPLGSNCSVSLTGARIDLPKAPLQSVAFVKYYDGNNVLQTLASSKYRVDTSNPQGFVVITDIPDTYHRDDAITIRFAAGYGNQEDVPETLRLAIRLLCGEWYYHREATVENSMMHAPMGVERLLDIKAVRKFV